MKKVHYLAFIIIILLATGCYRNVPIEPTLSSISIIDRNGLSETISNADRLKQYEETDFLANQPYKKVLRVYDRDCEGNINAYITDYHENGQPKQYLEIKNARAFGKYQEWYPNGTLKLDSNVIGGMADITPGAEATWLFEGVNRAWAEDGHLVAEFNYEKGFLEGVTTYYHPNGTIWKLIPYHKNQIEGVAKVFLDNGDLMQEIAYSQGNKNGKSIRYWSKDKVGSVEEYSLGKLRTGFYFDGEGKPITQVAEGNGFRAVLGKEALAEMHQYKNGDQEGEVKVFSKNGAIAKVYRVKNGLKHGEELEYYATLGSNQQQPKMSINWYEGKIHGVVKTWYDNGVMESQKEMGSNKKNGLLTAWYRDGNLMMIEEYNQGKLVRGEYFKKGERYPVSNVINGKGIATIYDPEGNFLQKVNYQPGSRPS